MRLLVLLLRAIAFRVGIFISAWFAFVCTLVGISIVVNLAAGHQFARMDIVWRTLVLCAVLAPASFLMLRWLWRHRRHPPNRRSPTSHIQ
jgi:hypothetical protein